MGKSSRRQPPPSDQDPSLDPPDDLEKPPANGTAVETETEEIPAEDDTATVQLSIKGSGAAVRAAAKRVGGAAALPVTTPAMDMEPPVDDPNAALLSDGKNMVIVTRQYPRVIEGPRGERIATNVRVGGKYGCPTSITEIESDVFNRFGGRKYKCTIHPDTSTGENSILGSFTIEHPDPDSQPFVEGISDYVEPSREVPTGGDPTLRETDAFAKMKAGLEQRLDRAKTMKDIKQLERMVKSEEEETSDKPAAPAVQVEIEEIKKLREENAKLAAQLSEKKVNDRFDKLENAIASLATAVAAKPPEKTGEDPFVKFMIEKSKSDDTRFTALMDTITKVVNRPPAPAGGTPEDNFDKMLERLSKMKTTLGEKDSRVTELQDKLIQASIDRLMDGGDGEPPEEEDAFKFALKQMTPVLKTYVEKHVNKTEGETGAPATPAELKKAYEDAGRKAAQEIAEKWQKDGLVVRAIDPKTGKPALPPPDGKPNIPVRHVKPGDRPGTVTDIRETSQGRVKTVHVQPADLSKKNSPPGNVATTEAEPVVQREGETMVKYTTLKALGEGGADVKVELPVQPGDMKYDRKRSVNFVLDSIRSEIIQGLPVNSPDDSFVVSDALELLDEEILEKISVVETGDDLEKILGPWSDPAKISAIKEAGNKDEVTKSWLRRIFITISDNFKDYKRKGV